MTEQSIGALSATLVNRLAEQTGRVKQFPERSNNMNALAEVSTRLPMPQGMASDFDLRKWRVLCETTFPSARTPEAIVMALDYCRARGLDVFKRPVNIVPMWNSTLRKEVETIWPGINEVQTTAARTKQWAGMDEPSWGEDVTNTFEGRTKSKDGGEERKVEVTYPKWCTVTVYRMIDGQRCPFTEPVYWLEAYSRMGGSELPTSMWIKRPRGQLHKVAKAASLRAAFPEEGEYTAEEMEGKEIEAGGVVIEHEAPAKLVKRTREQISAEADRKRRDLKSVTDDILQLDSLAQLERYEREELTPEFMSALGMKQYMVEQALETRRIELKQAVDAEGPSKADFIRVSHETIDTFESADELLAWWNSDAEKQGRRNYALNKEEVQGLMARVFEHRASLNTQGGSLEHETGDPTDIDTAAEPEERASEAPAQPEEPMQESPMEASKAKRDELVNFFNNAKTAKAVDNLERTMFELSKKDMAPADIADVTRSIERARRRVSKDG